MSAVATPSLLPPDMLGLLPAALVILPEHCREGLFAYLAYGVPSGHFLLAVLSNDLAEACGRADEANQRAIYDYVFVLHNYASAASWGSREAVKAWIARGQELRRQTTEKAGQS